MPRQKYLLTKNDTYVLLIVIVVVQMTTKPNLNLESLSDKDRSGYFKFHRSKFRRSEDYAMWNIDTSRLRIIHHVNDLWNCSQGIETTDVVNNWKRRDTSTCPR